MYLATGPSMKASLWVAHVSMGRRSITIVNELSKSRSRPCVPLLLIFKRSSNTPSNLHSICTHSSDLKSEFLKNAAAGLDSFASRTATNVASESALLKRKQLWERVKKELVHYWHGTKLLGKEIKISSTLASKLLQGSKLTRREQQQLRKTSGDLLQLVPFSVFVIVPLMEFLLPVALKLFPNMLPSTFEDALAKEEKKRRLFKLRLEMAKFLQETIEELGIPGTERAAAVREFGNFFRKIRTTGEQPSTEEFLRISNLLPDGLAFDSLSRPHLMSVCRYMNLNAFGTDNLLRHQIRIKMNSIKKDDKLIMAEGVDSLTANELQAACQHRSIPTDGVSSERLHSELTQWLELHLTHSIPHSLLILSRALSLPDTTANRVQEEKEELALEALKEVAKIKEKAWEKEKRVLQSEQHLLELCKHLNITSSWPAVLDGQGRLRDMKNSIEYILISGKFVYKNRQTTTN